MQHQQKRRRVGEGLSLEKFAGSKTASFDKQRLVQKSKIERLKRAKQYYKVKKKLLSEGKLLPTQYQPAKQLNVSDEETLPAERKHQKGSKNEKTKQHENPDSRHEDQPGQTQPNNREQNGSSERPRKRKVSSMQALANDVQKERDEAAKKKEAERAAAAKRQEAVERAQKKRKVEKSQYFKKTKRGQPVMKYRVDKILQQLTGS